MKKILIRVKASEELPAIYYKQTQRSKRVFTNKGAASYNHFKGTWDCGNKTYYNDEIVWYKEVSEEEYLQQNLAHAESELGSRKNRFELWHDGGEWMVSRNGDPEQTKPLSEIIGLK